MKSRYVESDLVVWLPVGGMTTDNYLTGYLLGFPAIRCWGGDFTTVLEVAYVRSTDRNYMIFLS
jgi:hypothetical protein